MKTGRILKRSLDSKGYHKVCLSKDNKRTSTRLHRLIADAFLENTDNKICVDHIDNNTLNNQKNAYNAKLSLKNASGVKGVTFDKSRNKWRANITVDGICINLYRFENIDGKKSARKNKANEVYGIYKNICES